MKVKTRERAKRRAKRVMSGKEAAKASMERLTVTAIRDTQRISQKRAVKKKRETRTGYERYASALAFGCSNDNSIDCTAQQQQQTQKFSKETFFFLLFSLLFCKGSDPRRARASAFVNFE